MHDMARPNVHLSCTQKKYVHRLVPRLFITVAAAESLIDFQLNTAFVAIDDIRKSAPGLFYTVVLTPTTSHCYLHG